MEIKIILSNLLLLSIESSYPLMNLPMEQFQRSPIKGTQEGMGSPSNCLNGLALVRPLSDFGNVSFQREIWKQSVWVNRRITIYIYRLSVRHCRCGPHVDIWCYHLTVIFVLFYIVSSLYYADFLGGKFVKEKEGEKNSRDSLDSFRKCEFLYSVRPNTVIPCSFALEVPSLFPSQYILIRPCILHFWY